MADSQRKTANLFDKDNVSTVAGYFNSSNTRIKASTGTKIVYVPCEANRAYTINKIDSKRFYAGYTTEMPTTGTTVYSIGGGNDWTGSITVNTGNGAKFLVAFVYSSTVDTVSFDDVCNTIMVNEGQTALPYEPYWQHSLRKLTTATEAVENPLYSDGTAITSYTIKGNEEHTGTPSPQNPVMPNGVGVRTENLFDKENADVYEHSTLGNTDEWSYSPSSTGTVLRIPCKGGVQYTLSIADTISNTVFRISETDTTNVPISGGTGGYTVNTVVSEGAIHNYTFTTAATSKYILFQVNANLITDAVNTLMLNTGSTAKPYEPYGYKIPISNGQQTTNIYLGSTQTTRQIRKLVLTGQENWGSSHLDVNLFALSGIDDLAKKYEVTAISTHYQSQSNVSIWSNVLDKRLCFHASAASNILYIRDSTYATVEDFTTFLSQQYANGTPVTVWYVLATETTGTVNEPLMKIGTYADSLSNAASIPTTEGANSITVDTTVQPSEFTATWTGWHNASVKEYDGSDWT